MTEEQAAQMLKFMEIQVALLSHSVLSVQSYQDIDAIKEIRDTLIPLINQTVNG